MNNSLNPEIDLQPLYEKLEGDAEVMEMIIRIFLDLTPGLLLSLEESIENADASGIANIAHKLRGQCSNFDLHRVTYFTRQMEILADENKFEELQMVFDELSRELHSGFDYLRNYLERSAYKKTA